MIEGLVDFGKLDTHVKSCGRPFREAVVGYFKKLGEERGYSIRENSPFVKYGLSLGRITLAWVETKTLFFC